MNKENKESPILHTYTLHDLYVLFQKLGKLEKENQSLRETVEFYAAEDDGGGKAMMTLRQLGE